MELRAEDIEKLNWPSEPGDRPSLLPLIAQNASSGEVLMLGYVSVESLRETFAKQKLVFFSRSKKRLWLKGETSGHFLNLESIHVDCDNDTLLALVHPVGAACHRGTITCFSEFGAPSVAPNSAVFAQLFNVLSERLAEIGQTDNQSYTVKLFNAGLDRILRKVIEESGEFLVAAKNWQRSGEQAEMLSEAVDILYHLLVSLCFAGIPFSALTAEIKHRFGVRREGATLERKI